MDQRPAIALSMATTNDPNDPASSDRDIKPENVPQPARTWEPPGGLVRRQVRKGAWRGATRPR